MNNNEKSSTHRFNKKGLKARREQDDCLNEKHWNGVHFLLREIFQEFRGGDYVNSANLTDRNDR